MPEKSKTKVESVFKKKTFLEKLWSNFITKVLGNERFWAIFTGLLLVMLLGPEIERAPHKYELGDIAKTTIKSPSEITVEDESDIEKRKEEAIENTLPVYDFLGNSFESAVNSTGQYFDRGRQILSSFKREKQLTNARELAESNLFRTARKQLFERLSKSLPFKAKDDLLRFHVANSFNKRMQDSSIELINRVYKYDIVPNKKDLERITHGGYIRREVEGEEVRSIIIDNIARIKSLDEIPSLLYQESVSLPDSPYLRRFAVLAVNPNLEFNHARTEEARQRAAENIEPIYYKLKKGEVIIREGDIIDGVDLVKISALTKKSSKLNFYLKLIGITMIIVCIMFAIYAYIGFFLKRYLNVTNLFILFNFILLIQVLLIKLSLFLADLMVGYFLLNPLNRIDTYYWAIPFAVGAMLLTSLVNQQIAIILSVVVATVAGLVTDGSFFVSFYALTGSLTAIYGIRHYRERTAILKAAIIVSMSNVIFVVAINLFLVKVEMLVFGFEILFALIGGFVVAFFVSFLLPIVESIFGIATDIKLLELSNMDRVLLQRLSVETPGTYQHSVMVGMLAEAAASEIGANPLFCRIATLYHDVGKLEKPEYFVENNSGAPKLHRKQKPHLSALILVNHVKRGITIARDHKVPQSIIDIIPQHHGTRLIGSFYESAKNQADPDINEIKEDDFRYPGPKPQTKEAAIIMIADSVEAASRTLKKPSPQKVRTMVGVIINSIFTDKQFDECQLTMIDLRKINDAMSRKLTTIFHGRVEYPQFDFNKEDKENDKEQNRENDKRKQD